MTPVQMRRCLDTLGWSQAALAKRVAVKRVSGPDCMSVNREKVLQQKWVRVDAEAEEWRDVPVLYD